MYTHPAEREAERLRTIIETMVMTQPHVTMQDAGPMIFEIEKKTAAMEAQQVAEKSPAAFPLPDFTRETIKKYIDLMPDIQDLITGSKKINAIKEVRAATGAGLKEAKDGVEYWEAAASRARSTPRSSVTVAGLTKNPENIASWIFRECSAAKKYLDVGNKIQAIKTVRMEHPLGLDLRSAKDGVEYFQDHYL